ncbi:SGNH/GDSL hydrolase family protein [Streptomyces sp. Ag109_G2-15]|uniref:SGNH/GDSL hydrolase family protein n=1 Tax=Streptomyces sp. Ag109_G2-15 TaxID=1938850 RepID=UPI000BDD1EA9|nr:SGNH/GDSL hydrolase family protein [Streptomyces sp. Ag109_G2-15]SOE06795.1 GDSL-like Lipase/Acylhydrolase family protein [Streptomyces sp. Ag109_G2-15]
MSRSRTASYAASLLLAAAACTLAGPVRAPAAPSTQAMDYVALGDSYSAGVGAGSYFTSGADCLRSSLAYPALWAAAHAPASFGFTACNGARTSDVMAKQLGPLSPRTDLVSLTVGGSDSGFTGVMATCVLPGTEACLSAVAKARSFMDGTLPGDLDRLYSAIRSKAPAAHVVVLGYPHLYLLHGTCSGGLADTERSALNEAVDELNSVIAERAADHGFTFADARTSFAGHEICSSTPWLHSVDWLDLTVSYHPTAPGQSLGYLPLLTGAA